MADFNRTLSIWLNKTFTPGLMFTKYEADLLCQNITYINTKGRGVRVSHPVLRIAHFAAHHSFICCGKLKFEQYLPEGNNWFARLDTLHTFLIQRKLKEKIST